MSPNMYSKRDQFSKQLHKHKNINDYNRWKKSVYHNFRSTSINICICINLKDKNDLYVNKMCFKYTIKKRYPVPFSFPFSFCFSDSSTKAPFICAVS